MPLSIYKLAGGQGRISNDFSYSNPILWAVSTQGGVLEAKFYLRMEDPEHEYLKDGTLFAVDTSGEDQSSWYSFANDQAGPFSSSLSFEIPLGAEVPVWIRVEVPTALEEEPKDDLRIAASYQIFSEDPADVGGGDGGGTSPGGGIPNPGGIGTVFHTTGFRRAYVTAVPVADTVISRIAYCQQSPHEAIPHGVPSGYDWYAGPTQNDPAPGAWGSAIIWGQIYLGVGHSLPANTRVQIKNIQLYGFSTTTHTWTHLQGGDNVQGARYVEDFVGNVSVADDHRTEASGGISITMIADHNYHFYSTDWPRPALPSNITKFLSFFEARLILDNPVGADNRATNALYANAGVDLYPTTTSTGGDPPVTGAGEGRFCYLDANWQTYYFCTVDQATLTAYPPPI